MSTELQIAVGELLEKIAQKHLGVQTLEHRNRDRLDFHEVGVSSLRNALEAAFVSGVEFGMGMSKKS